MTPEFAQETDRIFRHTLRLLDRVHQNEAVQHEREQEGLKGLFSQAESRLGQKPEWDLVKYAMVAWIDEMLIGAPWDGRDWWASNPLEFAFFRSRAAAKAFFDKANEAKAGNRRNAREAYYLCVILGFRGLYLTGDDSLIGDANLPKNIEQWVKTMAVQPQELSHHRPTISDRPREAVGAPPREGKFQFVAMLLLFLFLTSVTAAFGFYVKQAIPKSPAAGEPAASAAVPTNGSLFPSAHPVSRK